MWYNMTIIIWMLCWSTMVLLIFSTSLSRYSESLWDCNALYITNWLIEAASILLLISTLRELVPSVDLVISNWWISFFVCQERCHLIGPHSLATECHLETISPCGEIGVRTSHSQTRYHLISALKYDQVVRIVLALCLQLTRFIYNLFHHFLTPHV